MVILVWDKIIPRHQMTDFMGLEIKEWISANLSGVKGFVDKVSNWDILFGSLLGNIRLHQNEFVFNGNEISYELIIEASIRLQQECSAGGMASIHGGIVIQRSIQPSTR
ncbi:hypothetical protein V6N12_062497 [Hibiscus sabdariffa]|uniref:Uncharacterized protein n=1 Tax=Hibiscus sabdariffa TaxID=183260 RepID=A0ABR2F932_9ROSI